MTAATVDKDLTNTTTLGGSGPDMAEWSITHHGRYYHFNGYRYERLADAIAFAELVRARPLELTGPPGVEEFDVVEVPTAADRQLMLELSITFENGSFGFEGFRYDRLIDAVNYARQRRKLGLSTLE